MTNHSLTTVRVPSCDDIDRDETFATPEMVPAQSDNEVAGGVLAPVTDRSSSDIASMPYISRKDVLYFFEADSDLLVQCSLCLIGMSLELTVGAL
jgi:hypothetical protein